ncbi:MAG: FIST C-terminal domain-containing protein [Pararhodobacter sp.]|nr:FIST C-terminal domain-containing protein [Pararhodobacter sp.]
MTHEPGHRTSRPEVTGFTIGVASSIQVDPRLAIDDIKQQLCAQRAAPPDFVSLHHGTARPASALWACAQSGLAARALHGASSCKGVMTNQRFVTGRGDAIGAFAIWDPDGSYGTAMCEIRTSARDAAANATQLALSRAGRAGEAPDLVWLTACPGQEEEILEGIKDVIGRPALVVGGSAADNTVAGEWSVFTSEGGSQSAVVVTVMFPSVRFGCAFESGYAPAGPQGRVTAACGRHLQQIDDRPAAEVYAQWTGNSIALPRSGKRSILSQATLAPLGRRHSEIGGVPIHLLAHPAVAHADGTIELFCDVVEGEILSLMEGSADSLVRRAPRIASASAAQLGHLPAAGALVVYCGGCMLAIEQHMDQVADSIDAALDGAPFLGVFSFGEQGETVSGDSAHANLMISCTTFAGKEPRDGAAQGKGAR